MILGEMVRFAVRETTSRRPMPPAARYGTTKSENADCGATTVGLEPADRRAGTPTKAETIGVDPRRRRQVERASLEIRRAIGLELRRLRLDAGLSLRVLGAATEIDPAYIARIERGERAASLESLVRLATWLGADLSVRLFPRTRPLLRDHLRARMLEALLAIARPSLGRHLEVAVDRPGRAYIDQVLVDVAAARLVAVEAQSQLRRIELTVRRHRDVAEVLRATELARFARGAGGRDPVVDRLLLLRSSRTNREAVHEHRELMTAAYPASPSELRAAIAGEASWPGSGVIWVDIRRDRALVLRSIARSPAVAGARGPVVGGGALGT